MIGFLHPWALAGLLAAAIPILLHLLARREPPTVLFPAVRYLITTTREHQRRLKLQHLLLLLLRTLLIIALVLAAAGPTLPRSGMAGHAPGALVLVVDNSPSSGVIVEGTARLTQLQAAGRGVLARATADDALWLLAADGVPRRGDPETLIEQVGALTVSPRRLDLGAALGVAGEILAGASQPGEIALLTDLQASALAPAEL
ncbi:MAG: BatA domain-containing protein, partial [Gemmatimonadota bacterium]|nr:BatA domain-containing protein [Gemmatimonadota bacterium]